MHLFLFVSSHSFPSLFHISFSSLLIYSYLYVVGNYDDCGFYGKSYKTRTIHNIGVLTQLF
jgi:hypothetical protein